MDGAATEQSRLEAEAEAAEAWLGVLDRRAARMAPLLDRVGAVLRWMFRVGAGLLLLGILLAIVRREPLGARVDPLAEVLPAVLAGHASGVIDLAILWLMAAPVAATVVVFSGFLRMADRRYAVVTGLVLLVLAFSISRALR